MNTVKIDIFQKNVFNFIRKVVDGQTLLILSKENEPIVELKPIKNVTLQQDKKRPFGLCKSEFTVPQDFDKPLPKKILKTFGIE